MEVIRVLMLAEVDAEGWRTSDCWSPANSEISQALMVVLSEPSLSERSSLLCNDGGIGVTEVAEISGLRRSGRQREMMVDRRLPGVVVRRTTKLPSPGSSRTLRMAFWAGVSMFSA